MTEKRKKANKANTGKRRELIPSIPGSPPDAGFQPEVFLSWMYRDPAEVCERKEEGEIRKVLRIELRRAEDAERSRRLKYGLVSPGTVRLINRAKIQALLATVLGKKVRA
jgi:hypothetical protein